MLRFAAAWFMLKQLFWSVAIPLGLCAIALALQPWAESLPTPLKIISHYLPYVLLVATMVLCLSFNQTRVLFALLLTGMFLALLQEDLWLPPRLSDVSGPTMLALVSFLYPAGLAFLLISKERGLFTPVGMLRLVGVFILPLLVLVLSQPDMQLPMGWLESSFLPDSIGQISALPDLVLVVNALILAGLIAGLVIRPSVVVSGFLGLLLAGLLACHFYPSQASMQLLLMAGVLGVLISIVRNSFHMAYRDELTGLPARRALREQLLKLGRRYSIAMLDVDHFKKFNDRYGHDVGDQVLQMVAGHIAATGGGSKSFRYGGEEFTLVFPGKEADAVLAYLERLRQEIAGTSFIVRGKGRPRQKPGRSGKPAKSRPVKEKKRVKITISIGVSDSASPENSPAEVIKAADKALYRAKKKGRNRVST